MSVTNGANGAGDAAAMIEMTDVSKVFLTDEIETCSRCWACSTRPVPGNTSWTGIRWRT